MTPTEPIRSRFPALHRAEEICARNNVVPVGGTGCFQGNARAASSTWHQLQPDLEHVIEATAWANHNTQNCV